MKAGLMKTILLSGSGIFNKNFNIYFEPNCPERIVAPNCPRRIVLRRMSAPNCPVPNCPGTKRILMHCIRINIIRTLCTYNFIHIHVYVDAFCNAVQLIVLLYCVRATLKISVHSSL